jgi:replication factor A1
LAVEGFSGNRTPVDVKVSELNPSSRAVNVLAKLVSKSEIRNIAAGRDGSPHKVSDALVGDETGSVYLTLWDDNIDKVKESDTILVKNGYVNLFRGNIRLNIGKYGTLEVSDQTIGGEVNTENNVSSKMYEQERRPFRGRGGFGGGGGGYGGGRGGGYGGRDRRGGGGGYRQRRY